MTWRKIAKRVWSASLKDDVPGYAAQLAYYCLLAIFPFLLFLATLLGLLAHTGTDIYQNLVSYAGRMLPDAAFQLVVATLKQVENGAGGAKLSFGILFTLWAASSGMEALIDALNRAYGVKATRPWWKTRLLSLFLTILLSGFLIVATILVLYGSRIAELIANIFGLKTYFTALWNLIQWPTVLLFVLIAFGLLYRYAPDRPRGPWRSVLPGTVVGVLLWLTVSLLFRLYLEFFNSYNRTYGSLGAVIVLLLWFNLSSAAILVGAEVNAAIDLD